ncbi:hypothetical protein BDZ91DRAFT_748807, partial [Kalaharituber pfeilii]
MKFLSAPLLLVSLLALPQGSFASPAPAPEKLTKRAPTTCTVTGDGVRYRTCASTSCPAMGQYAQGTRVTLSCFVEGENIDGNTCWGRLQSNEYYITARYLGDCSNGM